MVELLIRISNWFGLLNKTIISFIRVLVMSKSSKKFLSQKANSDRIVLLGNGPSFKETVDDNFDFFSNNKLICLNHFANTDYYTRLKPEFYFIIAHDLFLDDTLDDYKNASIKLFTSIAEKTSWKLKFFITYEARKEKRWQQILMQNHNIEIIFMNITPVEGFRFARYHWYNKGLGMARPHNVMIPSMYFAICNGYKEIVIIGAEHSWLHELNVDDKNQTLLSNKHFYDNKNEKALCNYKGKSFMKLHEVLRSFSYAFESYHIVNQFAINCGTIIYNSSSNSFIDAFSRKKIVDLL